MGASRRAMRGIAVLAVATLAIASAQDIDAIVPEALVEALTSDMRPEESVAITRECFQRTCGSMGCSLDKIPCAPQPKSSPWMTFISPDDQKQKIVHPEHLHKHGLWGLVAVVNHKKPLDENAAITMPGIPAEASKELQKALHDQGSLIKKIKKMEKQQLENDPLHKQSRKEWLHLEKTIGKMPPSPEKIKNGQLLLKLAKELATQEQDEQTKADKMGIDVATYVKKEQQEDGGASDEISEDDDEATADDEAAADSPVAPDDAPSWSKWDDDKAAKALAGMSKEQKEALLKKLMGAAMGATKGEVVGDDSRHTEATKEAASHVNDFLKNLMEGARKEQGSHAPHETINGIPVSHAKCYERSCIKRDASGHCGAAVISCGPDAAKSHLSRKAALGLVKDKVDIVQGFANKGLVLEGLPQEFV